MKMAAFNAVCPYEIGDKIVTLPKTAAVGPTEMVLNLGMLQGAAIHTITDIACTHYIKTGKIEFTFELNNSGEYIQLATPK